MINRAGFFGAITGDRPYCGPRVTIDWYGGRPEGSDYDQGQS